MAATKMIFVIAILMALSITLTINISNVVEEDEYVPEKGESSSEASSHTFPSSSSSNKVIRVRVSRFLADKTAENKKNPKAVLANNCHKDNDTCYLEGRNGTVCCNNQCVDIKYNSNNCGACKKKCKYTEVCCRGQCVDTAYDKRHCGKCNNRCPKGDYCVYGMCDYP